MRFRVGAGWYRLRILEDVVDNEGNRLLGKADSGLREIHLSGELPPHARLGVLLHELTHAWEFHFPRPRTEEERCNFNAQVAEAAYNDLEEQGGRQALDAMPVETTGDRQTLGVPATAAAACCPLPAACDARRTVPPREREDWETTARSSGDRAQCGICETIIAGGAIVSSPARWCDDAGGAVVTRTMYCPHCNHLQHWIEGADLSGRPNGAVVGEPSYTRGEAVEAFLRRHPQAEGLIAM